MVARVLLVDDDPVARHTIKESLLEAGHDVISASSGGVALRHFEENPRTDVLIANVYMTHGDGIKVIAELNRLCPDLEIFALSPSPVPEGYLSAAKAFGASRIFMKPLRVEELVYAVGHLGRE